MAPAFFGLPRSLVDDKLVRLVAMLAPACRASWSPADLGCACVVGPAHAHHSSLGTISLVAGWPAVGLCRATQQAGTTSLRWASVGGPIP